LPVRFDPNPAARPGAGLLALDLDDGVAAALAAVALGPGTHLKSDHLVLGHGEAELARERLGAPCTRQLDQRPTGEHREQRLRLPLVDDAGGDDLLLEPAAGVQALLEGARDGERNAELVLLVEQPVVIQARTTDARVEHVNGDFCHVRPHALLLCRHEP
jgi:hypothetical protein